MSATALPLPSGAATEATLAAIAAGIGTGSANTSFVRSAFGYSISEGLTPQAWFSVPNGAINGSWAADVLTVAGLQTLTVTAADNRLIPGVFTRLSVAYNPTTGVFNAYRSGALAATLTVPAGPGRALDWQGSGRWYLGSHPSVLVGAPASQQISGVVSVARVYEAVHSLAAAQIVYQRGMGFLHDAY